MDRDELIRLLQKLPPGSKVLVENTEYGTGESLRQVPEELCETGTPGTFVLLSY